MAAVINRKWTTAQFLRQAEAPGRPAARLAGGWIDDLAALDKAILLCGSCSRKFDPKTVDYEAIQAVPGHRFVWSTCDGCKDSNAQCTLFMRGKK